MPRKVYGRKINRPIPRDPYCQHDKIITAHAHHYSRQRPWRAIHCRVAQPPPAPGPSCGAEWPRRLTQGRGLTPQGHHYVHQPFRPLLPRVSDQRDAAAAARASRQAVSCRRTCTASTAPPALYRQYRSAGVAPPVPLRRFCTASTVPLVLCRLLACPQRRVMPHACHHHRRSAYEATCSSIWPADVSYACKPGRS